MHKIKTIYLYGWLAIAAFATLYSFWAHLQIGLNNDHLALMDQAKKLLAGAIPYVDYVDVSPPMIHLLYTIPLMLSAVTGAPLDATLYLLTYELIIAGLLVAYSMLRHSNVTQQTSLIAVSALALALLFASFIHQPFADREHLMLVFIMPWLVLYSPLVRYESVPRWQRIAIALFAGIGFAIKPYFYIFYLASLYRHSPRELVRQREQHIVWGIGAAYAVIVFIFFREYLLTVLPVALQTYPVISWTWDQKIDIVTHEFSRYALPGVAATVVLGIVRRGFDHLVAYLYILLAAALVSYLVNGGWYYTQYPFIAISLVLFITVGARLIAVCDALPQRPIRAASLIIVSLLLAGSLNQLFANPARERAFRDMRVQAMRGHPVSNGEIYPPARRKIDAYLDIYPRFLFLGYSLWSVNLLKEGSPREHVGRFHCLWPLPAILRGKGDVSQNARYEKLRDYFTGSIADDIIRHKPELVIMDISPEQWALPSHYNVLPLLKQDARFVSVWKNYAVLEIFNVCTPRVRANCAYEVYFRKSQ